MSNLERKTYLFTLRVWAEPLEDSRVEWRGKLQPLPDGEAHYFRGWPGLVDTLNRSLASADQSDPGSAPPFQPPPPGRSERSQPS